MDLLVRDVLWSQFGAAIESLEHAIRACPEELWGDRARQPEFWYVAYHTAFFLDYRLSESPNGFAPPPPFTLSELDPSGVMPERVYSRREVERYLDHGRRKCRAALAALTPERAARPSGFFRTDMPALELHLHSLRHVQHHTAQLNLLLRQTVHAAPGWVFRASEPLAG